MRLLKKLLLFIALVVIASFTVAAQNIDTLPAKKDTLPVQAIAPPVNHYQAALQSIQQQNTFLNSHGVPVAMVVKQKTTRSNDILFYILAGLVFCMGLIKLYFARYFSNLFRVFFNTSLRQSQLADQLLQAKLPSLFFNAFFIISGGIYIFLVLQQYNLINYQHRWVLIVSCIVVLGLIYLVKYSSLKFTGWLTGYKEATDSYIFIIFMICKILGIILIPFTILMAFAAIPIASTSALISLLVIGIFLLLRFFRSYGLLQNQLKVSRFHFFLYIAGVEVIPLLLIYKGLLFLLSKNL
jgi:hypothetical protein